MTRKIVSQQVLGYTNTSIGMTTVCKNVWSDGVIDYSQSLSYMTKNGFYGIMEYPATKRRPYIEKWIPGTVVDTTKEVE